MLLVLRTSPSPSSLQGPGEDASPNPYPPAALCQNSPLPSASLCMVLAPLSAGCWCLLVAASSALGHRVLELFHLSLQCPPPLPPVSQPLPGTWCMAGAQWLLVEFSDGAWSGSLGQDPRSLCASLCLECPSLRQVLKESLLIFQDSS